MIASYQRLAALYHDLVGRESLDDLLPRAASAVAELVPCTSLLIAETDVEAEVVVPLLARGSWEEETMRVRPRFGEGRRGFEDALKAMKARAKVQGQSIALILVDLDDFKGVNDRYGHRTGGIVLRHVADRLRSDAPADSAVARVGGDEFAIVFVPAASDDVRQTLATIEHATNPITFVSARGGISLTASVGASEVAASDDLLDDELLHAADESMYQCKRRVARLAAHASA